MKGKIIGLFTFILLLSGCSTKRNTYVNRQYHNVTAYFNVLFNGRDSYKLGYKEVEKMEPETFDEILPVFAFEYPQAPGIVGSRMQRSIEKGNKTIAKHSITVKPKKKQNLTKEWREFYNRREFNNYVDDAHLVIGKSNLYMHEYMLAQDQFSFMQGEYPKESSLYEAKILDAVVYSNESEFQSAVALLNSVSDDKNTPRKYESLLNAAYANHYIKQKKYADAIPYLEKASDKAKGRYTKIRYNYILAQLYQRQSNNGKASEYYKKVLKKNPPYFTAFNAQMSMAFSYDSETHKGNVRKMLEKALKDDRNTEYLGQIYYALAKVEESSGNITKALGYYNQSISTSLNDRQKGLSYLEMARYHIKQPDYVNAYVSYDSAALLLGADHSLFEEANTQAVKLRKLATNMQVVKYEDSLQRLSGMSEKEINDIVEKRIKKAEEAQKHKAEEEQRLEQFLNKTNNDGTGQWYFYNANALKKGEADFESHWGKRKLEDNWRRRNKSVRFNSDESGSSEDIFASEAKNNDKVDKEALLSSIPKSDEAKKASEEKIVNAMFNVGEAYRDDMKNLTAAAVTFEKLDNSYPANNRQAETYVALYKLYSDMNNVEKAQYYKNRMTAFADNPAVLAATDPNYVARMQALETGEENDYLAALSLYTSGKNAEANRAVKTALQKHVNGRLVPQFKLLGVLTDNYNGSIATYKAALKDIGDKYPNTEAAVAANVFLEDITKNELSFIAEQNKPVETKPKTNETTGTSDKKPENPYVTGKYSAEDGPHLLGIVLSPKENINKLKFNLETFNADFFIKLNYQIKVVDFGNNKLIACGDMKDKMTAMAYYNRLMRNKEMVFGDMPSDTYTVFMISDLNMFLFNDSKSVSEYYEFFKLQYLQ